MCFPMCFEPENYLTRQIGTKRKSPLNHPLVHEEINSHKRADRKYYMCVYRLQLFKSTQSVHERVMRVCSVCTLMVDMPMDSINN